MAQLRYVKIMMNNKFVHLNDTLNTILFLLFLSRLYHVIITLQALYITNLLIMDINYVGSNG